MAASTSYVLPRLSTLFFLTILFSPPRWRINYIFPTSYGGEKCIYRDFIPTFLPSKKMFSIIFCYFFWGMDTSRELCQLQFEISDIKVQCYLTELPGSLYIDIPVRIKMHFMGDLFSNILLLISIRLAGFFFSIVKLDILDDIIQSLASPPASFHLLGYTSVCRE